MSTLISRNITDFLDELASSSPAPGGGSVAALAGALAAALSSMVCNLTIGKEKYKAVEKEIEDVLVQSEKLRTQLTKLVDADTEAFNLVMQALKMPKDTEEQKIVRQQSLQQAFKAAASTPLKTAQTCEKVLDVALLVAQKGNTNSITDAAVSALLAKTGVDSAVYNVRINLGSIKDTQYVETTKQELDSLQRNADEKTQQILDIVESLL